MPMVLGVAMPVIASVAFAQSNPVQPLVLPTANEHLLNNENEKFYMYVYRNFEGQESRPWTGGKYGFVRSMRRTDDGVIGTKFHEGIDIKPLKRDRNGRPLDQVRAIADGVVVHANASPGKSSYGNYVVIKHAWHCGPMYSLYAHLSEIPVKVGRKVSAGETIGQLGYTGSGLNRDRAHLHLELGILYSTRFASWHDKHFRSPNHHGIYNGMNIAGLDIASLYLAREKNPGLTIPQFVQSIPIHYKVTIPRSQATKGRLEILTRYPWLARGERDSRSASVEIAFSASGFPLSIIPSNRMVSDPEISWIRKCKSRHEYHTKGFVSGSGDKATLSASGKRYIELVCGRF